MIWQLWLMVNFCETFFAVEGLNLNDQVFLSAWSLDFSWSALLIYKKYEENIETLQVNNIIIFVIYKIKIII
jgi:hypothetical protein